MILVPTKVGTIEFVISFTNVGSNKKARIYGEQVDTFSISFDASRGCNMRNQRKLFLSEEGAVRKLLGPHLGTLCICNVDT